MARPPNLPKPAPPRSPPSLDMRVEAGGFLERRSYRRRRITDGLRLLPIFGLWLFMVPLLWPGATAQLTGLSVSMSSALIYIFAVWSTLIVICALLSIGQDRAARELVEPDTAAATPPPAPKEP